MFFFSTSYMPMMPMFLNTSHAGIISLCPGFFLANYGNSCGMSLTHSLSANLIHIWLIYN